MVACWACALAARLIKMGAGVGQLVEKGFGGFFQTGALRVAAGALKIRGQNDAGDKGADGGKNECDHTGKHRHLLFLTLLVLKAKLPEERTVECRALHHLERSVDWKLWGRELRGLRVRPFFLLLSPARHWLPAQPVSARDLLHGPSPFLWQVAPGGKPERPPHRLPGPFTQPCRALALQSGFTITKPLWLVRSDSPIAKPHNELFL